MQPLNPIVCEVKTRSEGREVARPRRKPSRSSAALREQLAVLTELLPVVAWTANAKGETTWVSDQWFRLTGLSVQETRAEGWMKALHPDDLETALREWGRCVRIGAAYEMVHRLRLRDGSFRWFRSRAVLERDSAGNALEWHGITDDIHKLKETQQALKQSEERFRRVVEHIHDALIMDDVSGRILFANDRFLDLFGFTRQELGSMVLEDYVAPEYRRELRERHDRRIHGEQVSTQFQYEGITHEGARIWLEADVVPVKNDKGRIIGTQSAIRDITTRRRAEEELQERENRLRMAVDTAALGFYERDLLSNEVTMNPNMREILGLGPERPPPDVVIRALHPDDRAWVQDIVKRSYDSQLREVSAAEFRIVRPNGQIRWVAGRGRVLFDLTQEPPKALKFVGVLLDVTERKLAEEEVTRAREDLARLNVELEKRVADRTAELKGLLADVEQMSYSMIHDLRAPLRAINSYAQMLQTKAGQRLNPTEHEFLHRIQESAERMDTLVRQTLTYSGAIRRDLPLEPLNTAALLREIIGTSPEFQQPLAEIQIEGELPQVMANPAALGQCVRNLLGNAVKFVRPGILPKVRIHAEVAPARDTRQAVGEATEVVRLWFEDNGIGIPPEGKNKLFGMFERLHGPEYPGTGIGLALVRKLMERMGGKVDVESAPGAGSRFWLELKPANNKSHQSSMV